MMTGDSSLTGGLLIGASDYLSPEQSDGRPADKRSDIYALGIILYEMTTGRRPFEAETPMAVMLKQMTTIPLLPRRLNPDMTPEVEQLILKALAGDPDDRFQAAAGLMHDFQAATDLTADPTPAASSPSFAPAPTRPPTLAKTSPWLWLALGLISLLVAAGLFVALTAR
jgi:serine/threonine-protein kinase